MAGYSAARACRDDRRSRGTLRRVAGSPDPADAARLGNLAWGRWRKPGDQRRFSRWLTQGPILLAAVGGGSITRDDGESREALESGQSRKALHWIPE